MERVLCSNCRCIFVRLFRGVLIFSFILINFNIYGYSTAPLNNATLDRNYKIDNDTSTDFLIVDIGANVRTPGEYSLSASIYDADDNEMAWSIDHKNLSVGYQIMHLVFSNNAIKTQRFKEPFHLGNLKLALGSSDKGLTICDYIANIYIPIEYNTMSIKNLETLADISTPAIKIAGIGFGELLLNFTIQYTIPVFQGRYNYDLMGFHIPPISSVFNMDISSNAGYSYTIPGMYIPGKPNNFTVTALRIKNLNIGLKKLQGSYENSSQVWKDKYTRIWITSQILADKNGTATTTSDLISPGSYDIKIFGDAVENVSQVNLTMTLTKKLIVDDRFNIDINTTGFPLGNYSITAKAINGSFSLGDITLEGVSTLG